MYHHLQIKKMYEFSLADLIRCQRGKKLCAAWVLALLFLSTTTACYGYRIDFADDHVVQKICGIEFLGDFYDVTFGVESTLLYVRGVGWVTKQVELPSEQQLPLNSGGDFFQIVADILTEPFYDCALRGNCTENNGDVYGIGSQWLDYNINYNGFWLVESRGYDCLWDTDQALSSVLIRDYIDPESPYFQGPTTCRIALVTKREPIPEPYTALLLIIGLAGFAGTLKRKKRI